MTNQIVNTGRSEVSQETHHELVEQARYWLRLALDDEISLFFLDHSDRETRLNANHELTRIAAVLGEDVFRGVVAEVENHVRIDLGDKYWAVFNAEQDYWKIMEEVEAARQNDSNNGPRYAISYLKKHVAALFPEMQCMELANVLRIVADEVEDGITAPPCDHDWHIDPPSTLWGQTFCGFITVIEHCTKCHAVREHSISVDNPEYRETVKVEEGKLQRVFQGSSRA